MTLPYELKSLILSFGNRQDHHQTVLTCHELCHITLRVSAQQTKEAVASLAAWFFCSLPRENYALELLAIKKVSAKVLENQEVASLRPLDRWVQQVKAVVQNQLPILELPLLKDLAHFLSSKNDMLISRAALQALCNSKEAAIQNQQERHANWSAKIAKEPIDVGQMTAMLYMIDLSHLIEKFLLSQALAATELSSSPSERSDILKNWCYRLMSRGAYDKVLLFLPVMTKRDQSLVVMAIGHVHLFKEHEALLLEWSDALDQENHQQDNRFSIVMSHLWSNQKKLDRGRLVLDAIQDIKRDLSLTKGAFLKRYSKLYRTKMEKIEDPTFSEIARHLLKKIDQHPRLATDLCTTAIDQIQNQGERENLTQALYQHLYERKDYERAFTTIDLMPNPELKNQWLQRLSKAFQENGEYERACASLNRMQLIDDSSEFKGQWSLKTQWQDAAHLIATICDQENDWARAFQVASSIQNLQIQMHLLTSLVTSFLSANKDQTVICQLIDQLLQKKLGAFLPLFQECLLRKLFDIQFLDCVSFARGIYHLGNEEEQKTYWTSLAKEVIEPSNPMTSAYKIGAESDHASEPFLYPFFLRLVEEQEYIVALMVTRVMGIELQNRALESLFHLFSQQKESFKAFFALSLMSPHSEKRQSHLYKLGVRLVEEGQDSLARKIAELLQEGEESLALTLKIEHMQRQSLENRDCKGAEAD
jgi:hypothetical protein